MVRGTTRAWQLHAARNTPPPSPPPQEHARGSGRTSPDAARRAGRRPRATRPHTRARPDRGRPRTRRRRRSRRRTYGNLRLEKSVDGSRRRRGCHVDIPRTGRRIPTPERERGVERPPQDPAARRAVLRPDQAREAPRLRKRDGSRGRGGRGDAADRDTAPRPAGGDAAAAKTGRRRRRGGLGSETGRGDAAAATWILRGDGSRRRRGRDADDRGDHVAAAKRSSTTRSSRKRNRRKDPRGHPQVPPGPVRPTAASRATPRAQREP